MTLPTKEQLTFPVKTDSSGTWIVAGEEPTVRPDHTIECVLTVKWSNPKDLADKTTPEFRLHLLSEASRFATADAPQHFKKAVTDYINLGLGTVYVDFDPDRQRLVEVPPPL